jgi:hypothetical protein
MGTYSDIGKRIVEEEQNGEQKAAYGHLVIKELSNIYQAKLERLFKN